MIRHMCIAAALLVTGGFIMAGEVLEYARQEVGRFARAAAGQFEFRENTALPEFSFAIERKDARIILEGYGEPELLQAAYTALEEMGCRFEVTGPVIPAQLKLDGIPSGRVVFSPCIQRRGIRQHINFNMDVSGYPLDEAREYIRNLARLRYNQITFHSYPCHWTQDRLASGALFRVFRNWIEGYKLKPEDLVSGGYFYGAEYPIPAHPLIRPNVRFNQKYFTAPEFEGAIHKYPERGQKASAWLREVMQEAKRCGLKIQFSTELCVIDDKYNEELAGRILKDYPLIDSLEFISAELGDMSDKDAEVNAEMAREIINTADDSGLVTKYPYKAKMTEGRSNQIRDYALNIRTIRYLQARDWEKKHNINLVCSSYACRPDSVRLEMKLAAEYLPRTTQIALMLGHSSREVTANIREANIPSEMFDRLIINSWLEFDGYMMLQQNTAQGLYDLVSYVREKTGRAVVRGILCNHWRTAPNAGSFRYLGQLSFDSQMDPARFYNATGQEMGIAETALPAYAQAMSTIDELSDVRAIVSNIGFNIMVWGVNPGQRNIGDLWRWDRQKVQDGYDRFAQVRSQVEVCRKACASPVGQAKLDYLLSGVNRSMEHLKGVIELKPIADKYYDMDSKKMRNNLSDEDKSFILDAANRADVHFQNYLAELSGQIRDRGEEGMLVTYYWGPVVFCNNIRAVYAGRGKFINMDDGSNVVPQPYTAKDEKAMGK